MGLALDERGLFAELGAMRLAVSGDTRAPYPRTMEQLESQLAAADVRLDDALLDRIDEIVPPGTNVNPTYAGWTNPALAEPARPSARRSPP